MFKDTTRKGHPGARGRVIDILRPQVNEESR